MSLKKIDTVLAAAFILFILWFGVEFILSPGATAPGFGLPSRPSGDGDGFLIIKGIRDVVLALVLVLGRPGSLRSQRVGPVAPDVAPGCHGRLSRAVGRCGVTRKLARATPPVARTAAFRPSSCAEA